MHTPANENHHSIDALHLAHERIQALETEITSLQGRLQDTQILNRIIQAVASTLDPTAAFAAICAELAHAYHVPQVALAVLDPSRAFLSVVAEYCEPGRTSGLGEEIPARNNPIMEYLFTHRQPIVAVDAQHDPRLPPSVHNLMARRNTASLMVAPVLVQDQIIGTVGIDAVNRREFSAEEIALAHHACVAISQALYNAQLHTAVQQELVERKRAQSLIQEQAALLAQLSTPLIPLSDQVLVLPLIGAVDTMRAQQITETLLSGVVEHKAQVVIIDITGLPYMDTHVAGMLTHTAQALQLLGSTTVLTGIRPEVAQTLVSLGLQLHGVRTFATLQSGIAFAIRQ